jgi:hypothetical protein
MGSVYATVKITFGARIIYPLLNSDFRLKTFSELPAILLVEQLFCKVAEALFDVEHMFKPKT